jgi:acetyl esterase/lipase
VPNYRLTRANQPIKHPEHASDVLSSLSFLTTWHGLLPSGATIPRLPYDPSRIYVIGHSCGAHIIASILLDSSAAYPKLTPPHPPVGSPSLLDAVQGVVLFEGIHDIDILLQSFPDYGKWFIAETIGPGPLYAEASAINYPLRTHGGKEQGTHIRWLVANSTGDTLIDFKQAEIMVDHLKKLYGAAGEAKVKLDLTTCKLEHKEDLITDEFIELMRAFICEI